MNIIVKKVILYYIEKYPDSKTALLVWYNEFLKKDFLSFQDIKQIYGNASIVANNRVVFNIKGNNYRLVVSLNFRQKAVYIIWFGTHSEYDKINVEIISFDTHILNHKLK